MQRHKRYMTLHLQKSSLDPDLGNRRIEESKDEALSSALSKQISENQRQKTQAEVES
jgi:hypothetical protein